MLQTLERTNIFDARVLTAAHADALRALDKELRAAFAASLVGTEQDVFVEEHKDGRPHGITSNFQPVVLETQAPVHGLVRVRIIRAEGPLGVGQVL